MEATVGRIVHYVMDEGAAHGRCRAAIVTETEFEGHFQLSVFVNGVSDGYPSTFLIRRTAVPYSEANEPGTWHWPERA